jgi:hypothetical protein
MVVIGWYYNRTELPRVSIFTELSVLPALPKNDSSQSLGSSAEQFAKLNHLPRRKMHNRKKTEATPTNETLFSI